MTAARALVSTVLSKGVISPGWYAILTGVAMLFVAYLLGSAVSSDPAAMWVGLVMGVTGVWSVERGVRAEVRRARSD
jgi:hypothetical protein